MIKLIALVTEASQFAGLDLWHVFTDLFRVVNMDNIPELVDFEKCLMFNQNLTF